MCGGWRTLCHTRWTRGRDAERSQPTPKGQKDGRREIPLPRGPRRSRIRGDRARNGGGAGADRGGCRWGRQRPQGPGDEGRTAADELEISRCVRSPQPANKGDRGRYRSDLTVGRSGTSCPLSFCFSQRATLGMSQGSCWEVGGGCPDESRGHETNARLHPRREARALAVSAAHPREACVACFRRDGSAQLCDFWRVVGPLIKKQKEGGYVGVSEKMTNRALHLLSLELGAPVGRQRETAQAGSWSQVGGKGGQCGQVWGGGAATERVLAVTSAEATQRVRLTGPRSAPAARSHIPASRVMPSPRITAPPKARGRS